VGEGFTWFTPTALCEGDHLTPGVLSAALADRAPGVVVEGADSLTTERRPAANG